MIKKFGQLLTLSILAMLLVTSCAEEDPPIVDPDPDPTLLEFLDEDGNYTILLDAISRAGLTGALEGNGPFTLFAPKDDAFPAFLAAAGYASLDVVPTDLLAQVLLNHVVSGKVMSTDLTDGYVSTLATESTTSNPISLLVDLTGGVSLNSSSSVSAADQEVTNGVIHTVSEVIALPDVVRLALDNPLFASLVAALTRADLTTDFVSILTGTGPFTVFAPTNDAFTALIDSEPTWNELADIPASTLETVLSYHVVAGSNVLSSTLVDGAPVTTFEGTDFTVNIDGANVSLTDGSGGSRNIIAVDVQGTNGVVHVIDGVLLP